jgi:hypothetical protein
MFSSQWQQLLQQTLHNDKWRVKHTDLPEYTGPHWTTIGTPSSSLWSTAGDRSDTSIKLFKPEFYVEFDIPASLQQNNPATFIDPTIFLSGLIKTLWTALATIWKKHLDFIHDTKATKTSPATLAKTITRVRNFQEYRHTVEDAVQTDNYFPPNIDSFLETSTLRQLQQYITQYSPVILASHAQAQLPPATQTDSSITPVDNPITSTSDTSLTSTHSSSQHPALEEAQHRKCTRQQNHSPAIGPQPQ